MPISPRSSLSPLFALLALSTQASAAGLPGADRPTHAAPTAFTPRVVEPGVRFMATARHQLVADPNAAVCPCFTEADLKSWFTPDDLCFDYSVGTEETPMHGTFLSYYTGEGLEAGVADYYYDTVPFCAAVNLTTFAGPFDNTLASGEYDACAQIVLDVAADYGMTCSETAP